MIDDNFPSKYFIYTVAYTKISRIINYSVYFIIILFVKLGLRLFFKILKLVNLYKANQYSYLL
jgi:hypothetical protein